MRTEESPEEKLMDIIIQERLDNVLDDALQKDTDYQQSEQLKRRKCDRLREIDRANGGTMGGGGRSTYGGQLILCNIRGARLPTGISGRGKNSVRAKRIGLRRSGCSDASSKCNGGGYVYLEQKTEKPHERLFF